MLPPTNLVAATILLLLASHIVLVVLERIFVASLPTIGWLLAQLLLMLAAAMTTGRLSLFLLLKVADYPQLTSNDDVEKKS